MDTTILFIGDVLGRPGIAALRSRLPSLIDERHADFVIANAENAADGAGITPKIAAKLLAAGVDIITTGNHVWRRPEVHTLLSENPCVLRPANFPEDRPGRGWAERRARNGESVAVINVCGSLFMNCGGSPFSIIDALVAGVSGLARHVIVDMHAEATSEKAAMGHHLAGRVTAVLGTHTHVQTADQALLPGGTAYITDVGMTGPLDSVIGFSKDAVLHQFLTGEPQAFPVGDGAVRLDYVIVTSRDGKAVSIERVEERLQ